jgi:diguanylate cyclase (GGDEF)-like protein/PAS domain S-box-containing protein
MSSSHYFKEKNIIIVLLTTTVICIIDLLAPLWYDVWVLYLIPLHFMFQSAKRPYIYSVIVTLLIAVALFFPHSDRTLLMHAAVNRITGIFGGWGVSVLLMQRKRLQQSQIQISNELENRVGDRTSQLSQVNISLQQEIDERSRIEKALRSSELKYKSIFENVHDVFYQADMNGIITDISPSIMRYSNYTREDLIGKPIADYYYNLEDRVNLFETMRKEGEVVDYEVRLKSKEDRFVIVSVNSHFLYDAAGNPSGVEGSFRDITDRKKATEELKRLNGLLACQAATDPLTGIPNRSKFNESLSNEILRSKRFRLPLSVIIFDIDHFKKINDTYGHNTGDCALQYLTGLVAKVVRRHDLFARWGGEEFLIMLTNTEQHGAELFAEKLRLMIEKFNIPEVGHLTCSFGVAEFAHDDTDDVLINRADQALYRAKAGGRNRVDSIPLPSHRF